MEKSAAWDGYDAWNRALAAVIFTPANADRSVYLDMDDDVLIQVATAAGAVPDQAAADLAAAVCGTLNLGGQGPVFAKHLRRLKRWRESLREEMTQARAPEPPPVLALLAVLTLAAEEMGHDADFAPNAYYPRLFRLLMIKDTGQQRRLRTSYMREAETLWRGLNDWLAAADGQFGLPSAYALSHRYIGLPMSQALVRAADRQHFPRMFSSFGLPPGAEVSVEDMRRMLDTWIRKYPARSAGAWRPYGSATGRESGSPASPWWNCRAGMDLATATARTGAIPAGQRRYCCCASSGDFPESSSRCLSSRI